MHRSEVARQTLRTSLGRQLQPVTQRQSTVNNPDKDEKLQGECRIPTRTI